MPSRLAALACALAGALGILVLPAATANADTVESLPIKGFHQIVADSADDLLFLSEGSGTNSILVTDLAGDEVAAIMGQNGAEGMTLSPDGGTLYVALAGADAISAISTATLTQTALYPLDTGDKPEDVVVQDGSLWVSYTGKDGLGAIGQVDLSAGSTAFTAQPGMGSWSVAPELAADPDDSGTLVADEPGSAPGLLASFDVSTSPVTVYNPPTWVGNCSNAGTLAVVPGGGEFLVACGSLNAYRTTDFRLVTSYLTAPQAGASSVAIAADGTVAGSNVAAVSAGEPPSPDVYIYQSRGRTAAATYELDSVSEFVADNGIAWSADSSQLYAVIEHQPGSYSLHVLYPPRASSALTLTGSVGQTLGTPFTLTGMLSLTAGTPPTGSTISVTRTPAGTSSGTTLPPVQTAPDGSFTVQDTVNVTDEYIYIVSYDGSSAIAPASATFAVEVSARRPQLTVNTGAVDFGYPATVHVTAHLGPTGSNRRVSMYAGPYGGGGSWKLLKTGLVNAAGNLSVTYAASHSTIFAAAFSGDSIDVPATTFRVIYVGTRVSMSNGGYYTSVRIGGITYHVYHHTAHLTASVTVDPNKHGQCVDLQVQQFKSGTWHPGTSSGCLRLNSSSQVASYLSLLKAGSGLYRVRADYIRSATDNSNLSTDGSWFYYKVVT